MKNNVTTVEEILSTAEQTEVNEKKLYAREHRFGAFTLRIVPKSDSVSGASIVWRKGMEVEGTLSFKNNVETINPRDRVFVLHKCQAKSVRNLFRSIFSKAWSNLYQYAEALNATEFKISYLQHRIKIHARWVDHHIAELNATDDPKAKARHRKFVIDNSTTEKKLTKRLDQILENIK